MRTARSTGPSGPDAPGDQGFLLIRASPAGATFVWETASGRQCWAAVNGALVSELACTNEPVPVKSPAGITDLGTLFPDDGWMRLFAADHQLVVGANCGGRPVEVLRAGTAAGGARTLYAVWFPDYTKGAIGLRLSRAGTVSEDRLALGDAGESSCDPAPAPAPAA
ncbi:hypothetical protein OG730_18185 [Streptomyces sp. NBC_01298]|uniref:hypothetical protein n=1 Tax=Streptomyces sp. NBC_01298 TaxID=2903817 RepID=UPI002E15728B|nr:hypothetical protein OG730_18185 [Streptomyces sp. NBC_01298]